MNNCILLIVLGIICFLLGRNTIDVKQYKWHHLAVTYDDGIMKTYIDGTEIDNEKTNKFTVDKWYQEEFK